MFPDATGNIWSKKHKGLSSGTPGPYNHFDPPNNLLTNQMTIATTTTTNRIPDHTPALKIPSIAAQLDTSTNKLDISANGIIFFINTCFKY